MVKAWASESNKRAAKARGFKALLARVIWKTLVLLAAALVFFFATQLHHTMTTNNTNAKVGVDVKTTKHEKQETGT